MGPLLFRKFHEYLLAFRILEPLAVFLEELVRPALAANADHQRLLIVDASGQAFGTLRKQPVGGALEKQEGRARLQRWIRGQQLRVARLERSEVLLLFLGKLLKYAAPARILRDASRRACRIRGRCARWRWPCGARPGRRASRWWPPLSAGAGRPFWQSSQVP